MNDQSVGNLITAVVHLLCNVIGGKDIGVPVQVGVLRPGGVAAK